MLVKILVTLGSGASVGFGVWHFFVPKAWKWYSYIDPAAAELVAAVRAVNFFFSLCLVLFGAMNILMIFSPKPDRYSILVVLSATCLLWLSRVILQFIFPQGSLSPVLQYGMLSAFIFVALCHIIPLVMITLHKG